MDPDNAPQSVGPHPSSNLFDNRIICLENVFFMRTLQKQKIYLEERIPYHAIGKSDEIK